MSDRLDRSGLAPGWELVEIGTSTNRPTLTPGGSMAAALTEGRLRYETDTDKLMVWNGSAWVEVQDAHNHDADYADIAHDHDADYAAIDHTHTTYPLGKRGLTSSASNATTSSTTELTLLTLSSVSFTNTRTYEIKFHAQAVDLTTNGDLFIIRLKVNGVTQGQSQVRAVYTGTQEQVCDITIPYVATATASYAVVVTAQRYTGSGTASFFGDLHLWVTDIG